MAAAAFHLQSRHDAPAASAASARFRVPCAAMGTEKTDEELMLAYAHGDTPAFDELYRRARGMLYRFILRSVPERAVADELFQETWSRAIHARTRYRIEAKFSTWLLQIAHNLVIDHFRRTRPQADAQETEHVLGLLDVPDHERPEEVLSEFERRRRLQLALAELPDDQRVAFLLRMESGLGLEEIARVTGAGHETVKSRLRYAFAKIRERLAE
ncbi:MAG: RNA polymerase sigma factor [Rudaea sp.]|nr:RNA polymerase sigma factor [Rudaea sp.]MBR0344255.1 RNA polymerase sigma factor [Rudaea sp.]